MKTFFPIFFLSVVLILPLQSVKFINGLRDDKYTDQQKDPNDNKGGGQGTRKAPCHWHVDPRGPIWDVRCVLPGTAKGPGCNNMQGVDWKERDECYY